MNTDIIYRAALYAQIVSLTARYEALAANKDNLSLQIEAGITYRQIEALENAMKETAKP